MKYDLVKEKNGVLRNLKVKGSAIPSKRIRGEYIGQNNNKKDIINQVAIREYNYISLTNLK